MGWVGIVCEPLGGDDLRKVGTCFALGERGCVVTAHHVVEAARLRGIDPLWVSGPGCDAPVQEVVRYPEHELAVLRIAPDAIVEPFAAIGAPEVGEEALISGVTADGRVDVETVVLGVDVRVTLHPWGPRGLHTIGECLWVSSMAPVGPRWSGAPVHSDGHVFGALSGAAYKAGDPRVQRPDGDIDSVFVAPIPAALFDDLATQTQET